MILKQSNCILMNWQLNYRGHFINISVLLINFLRNLDSNSDEDCSLVDNRADDTIKRPEGGLYAIELEFCGLLFDAKIVRMGSWLSQPGSPPQFTLSMQWKAI